MFKNILKDLDAVKEKLKGELEEMAQMTMMLKEGGIEVLNSTKIPNFVIIDRRLTHEAKILYCFLQMVHSHQRDNEGLNHKAVADALKLEREEYNESMDLLRALGLVDYNEKNGRFKLPSHPEIDSDMVNSKVESMKEEESFIDAKSVEDLAEKLNKKAKELDENVVVKPVSIDKDGGNVYRQIFEKITSEIAENIPDVDDLGKINIEIDFNTGIASVHIERE